MAPPDSVAVQSHPGTNVDSGNAHKIFLSLPMSAWGSWDDFQRNRGPGDRLANHLRSVHGTGSVYYAPDALDAAQSFSALGQATERDLGALQRSRLFLLYYPVSCKSSVVFEAGVAAGLGIPSLYVVHHQADLPYLMRDFALSGGYGWASAALVEVDADDDAWSTRIQAAVADLGLF